MASGSGDDEMELPPGFRFHPTDEELITHYLSNKVLDTNFSAKAIGEVDVNRVEPWDLPWRAKMGEKEWYFFCVRDKKYPTGLRTNRATAAGYWKATGKDKEIFRGRALVGMKKTLVFYKGRAPNGERTNWVTHEYRLEGNLSLQNLSKPVKNDWVISRVFHKTSGGKKVHISGIMRMNSVGNEQQMVPSSLLHSSNKTYADELDFCHVHCFSNPTVVPQENKQDFPMEYCFSTLGQLPSMQTPLQDPSILRSLLGNYGQNMNQMGCIKPGEIISVSQETDLSTQNSSLVSDLEMGNKSFQEQQGPASSIGPQDFDCIWGY